MNLKVLHNKLVSNTNPGLLAGVFLFVLKLFSYLYCFLAKLRITFYQSGILKSLSCRVPVIVVGNITAGGTGKTPFCLELINLCQKENLDIGLVSRGYGGDESKIYQNRYPHLPLRFHHDRVKACKDLIENNPQVKFIIADDGFQHLRLMRNLDIVLVNAINPFGYAYCLPRGYLREPLSGLKRAGAIVITHANEINEKDLNLLKENLQKHISQNIPIYYSKHLPIGVIKPNGEKISLNQFKELTLNRCALLSGVANPVSFKKSLEYIGVNPTEEFVFDDHHHYQKQDFDNLINNKGKFDYIMTTEKDIVKIPENIKLELNIYTLQIKLEIQDSELLIGLIKKHI